MAKTTGYNEGHITAFKRDLDKIRAKPQLYIGPTDAAGVFTILREVCDNAVDEARAGRNTQIDIWLAGDGSMTVADHGLGIPLKKHEVMKISTLTHVLTNLQSSGKMKVGAYDSAIGTHGVGIKATNALSESFRVWTYRADAGGWHHTAFAKGQEKTAVAKSKPPKLPSGAVAKLGTVMTFTPDASMFAAKPLKSGLWFPTVGLQTWCELTSYMNAGLTINLNVVNAKAAGGWSSTKFYSKDGIAGYLAKRITDLKASPLSKKPLSHTSQTLELALHFADVEGCEVEFFTNTIRNVEQGVHADAFFRALVAALKPYKGKLEYTPLDLREGLVGLLNCKINAPQFDSQTKEKLVDQRVKEPLYTECLEVLTAFFDANKTLAKEVSTRAAELRKKTADFLKDKALIKGVNKARKIVSLKLGGVDAASKIPRSERELYLVEGDSAGGTAKRARYRDRQAVFPLKGKILNVAQAKKAKVVANEEIAGILAALGVDLSKPDPLADLNYGTIINMADPDVDGSHINCLLLTFFWTYTPELIKRGCVYVLAAPEFMTRYKDRTYFGLTKEELYKRCGTDKISVQHIKGWGEIDDEDLREAGMNPATRRMYRIMPPKTKKGVHEFKLLMSEDTAHRKAMLGLSI